MDVDLCERLREEGLNSPAMTSAVELVRKTAWALARRRRIVPPLGGEWCAADVHDLVGEFFADPGRIMDLVVRSGNDNELKAGIATSLRRVSVDMFRQTPLGTLHRRIDRRMKNREDVTDVPPRHWSLLAHAEAAHWGGGHQVLAAAAASVTVTYPKDPPPESEKRSPVVATPSLDAVCTAVLDRAAAPVAKSDVRMVVAERILPTQRPKSLDVGGEHGAGLDVPDPATEPAVVSAVAHAIWDSLGDDERTLLPWAIEPLRGAEAAGVLGLKKSAIDARSKKLCANLAGLLEGFEHQSDVLRQLLELADRTKGAC